MSAVRRLRDDDVRLVPISRSTSESLYHLQRFLIRIEAAVVDLPRVAGDEADPFSSWANACGAVVGSWQTADAEGHSVAVDVLEDVPLSRISYVLYTNRARTSLLRGWPTTVDGGPAWRLEAADRPESAATWGPPRERGFGYGELGELDLLARRLGYDGEREVELRPVAS